MSAIRILFLGDMVGEPGRKAVIEQLPLLKQSEGARFYASSTAKIPPAGKGITPKIAIDLLRAGAAVITTGDHVWDQQEIVDYFPTEPRLLRPLNYPEGTPGDGSVVLETAKGRVGVIQAQGRSFIQPPLENPYLAAEKEAERLRADGVMADRRRFPCGNHQRENRDGPDARWQGLARCVGTHTHVQTADETIFPGGTGYLTDAGMCGPEESILGRSIESVVWRFKSGMPTRFPIAKGPVRLCGVIVDVDVETGTLSGHPEARR